MQTESQKALYWELEQIVEPTEISAKYSLTHWLIDIWQSLTLAMTPSNEPEVWQGKDWFGYTWWNVYLPSTGQTIRFASEEEVRIWLEEHLYHL